MRAPLSPLVLLLSCSLIACDPVVVPASDAGDPNPVIDGGGGSVDGAMPADAGIPGEGVDILFVIDNSGSMREEQSSLTANFIRFANVLTAIEGGLPDVHIGVVSTDMGAGPFGIAGCTDNGDNGALQSAPQGACMPAGPEPFIRDVAAADGASRIKNYSGALADAFSCVAALGITGCGFEQPLESMRRALDGTNGQNAGFLRPEAYLAVIIITDEDDCSVENVAMFDSDPALDNIDSSLGPLASFRCFEFGVECQPDTPRTAGPRADCVPRDNSQFMHDVSGYVAFLKDLKANPDNVIVAGIIGNPTPVTVGAADGDPRLEPSCASAAGEAAPGLRLGAFLAAFPGRSTSTTICNEDLSDALTVIAELLADVIVSP